MIRAYTGKTGSGKTYLMIKDAYRYYKNGVNIYSNTILSFPKRKRGGKIKYFEHINEVIHIKDGLVLFDEAGVLFNSRNWESLPDEFQYKLQQHRKHKIDLICTTQNMGTIDIVYRRLVHDWIYCKSILQIGSSPRILIGIFQKHVKDVDYLYNNVDDLVVPATKKRWFFIHFFSKKLYDTMFDIGFKRYKTIWLSFYEPVKNERKRIYLIVPRKMTRSESISEIRKMKALKRL